MRGFGFKSAYPKPVNDLPRFGHRTRVQFPPRPLKYLYFMNLKERLLSKVRKSKDGCWLWTGALRNGYGCLKVDGVVESAHRLAYKVFVGELADDAYVCATHVMYARASTRSICFSETIPLICEMPIKKVEFIIWRQVK